MPAGRSDQPFDQALEPAVGQRTRAIRPRQHSPQACRSARSRTIDASQRFLDPALAELPSQCIVERLFHPVVGYDSAQVAERPRDVGNGNAVHLGDVLRVEQRHSMKHDPRHPRHPPSSYRDFDDALREAIELMQRGRSAVRCHAVAREHRDHQPLPPGVRTSGHQQYAANG